MKPFLLWTQLDRDVVVNVLHYDNPVSEFELRSRYYVHFRIPFGKVWTP